MVELAVLGIPGLTASSFEVDRGGVSYTFDTMKTLTEQEPDTKFHFIIGGDMIDTLHKWYKIDELMKMVTFVGVSRPGTDGETKYPITMVRIPEVDLSSTLIRNRMQTGGTIQFLVPENIVTYIRQEGLYGYRNAHNGT